VARLTIRGGRFGVKRMQAEIKGTDREVDVTYDLVAGHYYFVRSTQYGQDRLLVLRATNEMNGRRPMFTLAPGEDGHLGPVDLLIIADLGEEAP